jgi:hypothetical protein
VKGWAGHLWRRREVNHSRVGFTVDRRHDQSAAGVWSARPDWTTLANWEAAKSDYRISITQATDLISAANQYLCR